jgi:hypothetical protein
MLALAMMLSAFVLTAQANFIDNSVGLSDSHTTITFDEHVFPSWTVITNQYSDLGVSFSPFAIYAPYGTADVSNFYPNYAPLMGAQQIQFTTPQTEAAFNFYTYAGATVTLQALLNGIVVETDSGPEVSGYFYGFSNITFDAITVSTNAWPAWMIDNIQLAAPSDPLPESVPEPTILVLIGMGVFGMFGARRRRLYIVPERKLGFFREPVHRMCRR